MAKFAPVVTAVRAVAAIRPSRPLGSLYTAAPLIRNRYGQRFFSKFGDFFDHFASSSKFSDVLGPIWMRSDLLGRVRTRSDAFRCIPKLFDAFGKRTKSFGFLNRFSMFSEVILQHTFVTA